MKQNNVAETGPDSLPKEAWEYIFGGVTHEVGHTLGATHRGAKGSGLMIEGNPTIGEPIPDLSDDSKKQIDEELRIRERQ